VNHAEAVTALTTGSTWRKSSYSQAANDCVEITTELGGWVGVRDSKLGSASPIVAIPAEQWHAFTTAVKAGDVDA
jgi:hypothetical protein